MLAHCISFLTLLLAGVAASAQTAPAPILFPQSEARPAEPPGDTGTVQPSFAGDECSPIGKGKVYRISQQAVRYCGIIDSDGIEAFEGLLDKNVSDLVITSAGGAKAAPITLARIVQTRGLNVEVAGPCFSGCAAFVFIAGKSRTLSSTALLGLHQTASSSSLLLSRQTGGQPTGAALNLLHRAQLEGVLYASRGVDLDLLYVPQLMIETLCTFPTAFEATAGETIIQIVSDYDVWVPTGDALNRFGVKYIGKLPNDYQEAVQRYRTYMSERPKLPEFATEDWDVERSPYLSLYKIGVCPAGMIDALSEP